MCGLRFRLKHDSVGVGDARVRLKCDAVELCDLRARL